MSSMHVSNRYKCCTHAGLLMALHSFHDAMYHIHVENIEFHVAIDMFHDEMCTIHVMMNHFHDGMPIFHDRHIQIHDVNKMRCAWIVQTMQDIAQVWMDTARTVVCDKPPQARGERRTGIAV